MTKDFTWAAISAFEQSEDWKIRLKGEYYGLVKRIHGLKKAISSSTNPDHSHAGYSLIQSFDIKTLSTMKTQLKAMEDYRDALAFRASHEGIDL